MVSCRVLLTDTPVSTDQQKFTYINSVLTLDAVKKTCQKRWLIEKDGEKELKETVLSARIDDDDEAKLNLHKA